MNSDWPDVRLEEISSVLGDGLHGTPEYSDDGEYFFINGNNLSNGKIVIDEKTRRASEEEYLKYKKNLNDRTILVSINGTIGNVALYRGEKVFLGKSACYFNVIDRVDKQFVRYVITSDSFQNYINTLATGTTIKNVSLKLMRDFTFKLPPLDVQRSISAVLGSLDDKIELNRRMNETLEAVARAMFKSWFVDFDPVRAKMNGEPPESICQRLGLAPDLLALFPDRLVDSELGEIPEGWKVGTIDVHCYLNAKSWTAKTIPHEVHYVDLANTKDGIISEVKSFQSSEAPSRARRILRAGDTIVGTVRPGNRSFALIGEGGPALTGSTGFAVLSPRRKELRELVYFLATDEENIDRLSRLADGAAYPAVRPEIVTAGKCVFPNAGVIDAFHVVVAPMIDSVIFNRSNNGVLSDIRDALLPILLSGELRVPDADKLIEEATA